MAPSSRRSPNAHARRQAAERIFRERNGSVTQGLIRALEGDDRFRRDGRIGGIFHPGRISFRELTPRDSLHIIIDGEHVSAHVDDICPIRCEPGGVPGYTWALVLAHNVSGFTADLGRRIRRQHGEQRCNLGCEMVWVNEEEIAELATEVQCGASSEDLLRTEDRG